MSAPFPSVILESGTAQMPRVENPFAYREQRYDHKDADSQS
jgi:hypothetical protein